MSRWAILIAGSISVPYVINFLNSLFNVLFASNNKMPGIIIVLWVFLVEMGHTFGVALLVFKILPNLQNVTGLFLMNALCLVPAVLKIIFTSYRGMTRLQKLLCYLLDVLAIACQATVFVLFKFYAGFDVKPPSTNTNNLSSFDTPEEVTGVASKDDWFVIYVALSSFLISLSYWQNFTEVRFSSNRITLFLQNQINDLRKHNAKIYMIISPLKVLMLFVWTYLMLPESAKVFFDKYSHSLNSTTKNGFTPMVSMGTSSITSSMYTKEGKIGKDLFMESSGYWAPFITHVVSSLLCYYTGRITCKVLMQGIGFALPLALTTPLSFLIFLFVSMRSNGSVIPMVNGRLGTYFYWEKFNGKSIVHFSS